VEPRLGRGEEPELGGVRPPDAEEPGAADPIGELGGERASEVPEEHRPEGDGLARFDHEVLDEDRDPPKRTVGQGLDLGEGRLEAPGDHGVEGRIDGLDPFPSGSDELGGVDRALRDERGEADGVVAVVVGEGLHGGDSTGVWRVYRAGRVDEEER